MTDPQPATDSTTPIGTDPVAQVEAAAARLGSSDQSASVPLAELTEQLTSLHEQLQSALSELDRT